MNKKTAIVTGASRGIGASIAKRLAKDGHNVVLNCKSSESEQKFLVPLKKTCEDFGVSCKSFVCDVSDFEQCEKMVEFVKENFSSIDFLINNAGITKDCLLARMQPQDFDTVLNVNLKGVFNLTKLVSKTMVRQKSGRIVNVSSVVGLKGNIGQFNYAGAKAAIVGMTKSAAKELGKKGILVNAVAPGFVKTQMTEKLDEAFKEKIKQNIVLKRFAEVEDVSGVVSFLCGKDSSYITGQVIVVDGLLLI